MAYKESVDSPPFPLVLEAASIPLDFSLVNSNIPFKQHSKRLENYSDIAAGL